MSKVLFLASGTNNSRREAHVFGSAVPPSVRCANLNSIQCDAISLDLANGFQWNLT